MLDLKEPISFCRYAAMQCERRMETSGSSS